MSDDMFIIQIKQHILHNKLKSLHYYDLQIVVIVVVVVAVVVAVVVVIGVVVAAVVVVIVEFAAAALILRLKPALPGASSFPYC